MTGAEATLAVVRELALDDVSREYVSLESRLGKGARWSVFQRAEVDLNRGWRETLSGRQYQLSNLSLSGTVRLSTGGSASLSYDNRRNYRTHLNRSVPESVFDDLMHQGFRASVNVGRAWGPSFNASVGVRLKEQETARTYSVSAGVRHGDLWSRSLSLGLDAAGYSNAYTDGALVSVRAGKRLHGGHSVDLSYGGSFYRLKSQSLRRATHWVRGSGHVQLPRGLYLSSDLEYGKGDDLSGPRGLAEVGWRF